ncbi:SDR family NAD(P)-dependent oxidoreductase [Paracoccus alkanivorans]|uniref:SDR family NAD(P)-dependent oxidoreductase n=1 Tax=Paracoccus alkanivorans TaxID=2116655 RepID=UPI001FB66DA3|nr:SDR family NAD(P)-dependent oxidoreductase [Paracoccus alkanivorans]
MGTDRVAYQAAAANTARTRTKIDRINGRVDVLINNAGIVPLSSLETLKVEEWDRMIDADLKGALHGIAAVLLLGHTAHQFDHRHVGRKVLRPIGARSFRQVFEAIAKIYDMFPTQEYQNFFKAAGYVAG